MIQFNRQIVWSPVFAGTSLSVALDRTFAEACIVHEHPDMQQFVEGVWRFMGNRDAPLHSNFFDPYKGILPKGFYAGHDGLWLTLDSSFSTNPRRPIMYHGHNEDRHTADLLWLQQAFAAWAEAAIVVMNWE